MSSLFVLFDPFVNINQIPTKLIVGIYWQSFFIALGTFVMISNKGTQHKQLRSEIYILILLYFLETYADI